MSIHLPEPLIEFAGDPTRLFLGFSTVTQETELLNSVSPRFQDEYRPFSRPYQRKMNQTSPLRYLAPSGMWTLSSACKPMPTSGATEPPPARYEAPAIAPHQPARIHPAPFLRSCISPADSHSPSSTGPCHRRNRGHPPPLLGGPDPDPTTTTRAHGGRP
jgi:hypothetical protein